MTRSTRTLAICTAVVVLTVAAGAAWWYWARPTGPIPAATHVGRQACAGCHAQAEERWRGSHHALAMQPASEATVAGDFKDTRFTYGGVTSTFSRRDGRFVVRTDGPDGRLQDHDVRYTFGVAPLQQYLLELPGGRLQALSIAWDTRPREQGGQRWFHLYPGERVTSRDVLHWTAPSQNWNHMCAECHSTAVRKNYDAKTGRFATSYAEVNVACEACHGPGSNHVAWARREGDWRRLDGTKGLALLLDERKGATWAISPETGNARRSPPDRPGREIEMCGRCHARRGQLTDDYRYGRPLGDTHRVALLEDRLYHFDGQVRDEVYEYGSFLQSKMFRAGVTCSDCHDPHSGALRAPGAQVCLGCHAAGKYENPAHHRHKAGSPGAGCLGCHMPATTYMVVDPRHDHGFRVPRPDLSVALGVPNACTACHKDRPAAWAAGQIEAWYGRPARGSQRYAEAFAAAATGAPGAAEMLTAVARDGGQPAIARASALERLARFPGPARAEVVRAALGDPDSLVRRAAVFALDGAELVLRVELVAPRLDDAVRVVRLAAARVLADVPRERLTEPQRAAYDRSLAEYVAAEQFNADRPESHLNLALLYLAKQRLTEAETELRTALALDPRFTPAAVNLADLHRAAGRDAEGERVLRQALEHDPQSAAARHALGLSLVRQKRSREALAELGEAARLDPDQARYGYVYGVALHEAGQRERAREALGRVLARHPYDREALAAAVAYAQERKDPREALTHARRLAEVEPSNPDLRRLVERLEAESRK